MKKQLLPAILFLFLITFMPQLQAQVIITEADFPRPASFVDSVYESTASTPQLPSLGADQVWDYSDLILEEINEFEYFDATADVNFTGALNRRESDLIFQGFYIDSEIYEGYDSEGWYELGRNIVDVSYSITPITGGPNDLLDFPGSDVIFEGRINNVKFPMAYEDDWNATRVENLPFELTVVAFGLDHTPGYRQRTVENDRSIVGYGELILPRADGSPTAPMDVLLLELVETMEDSFFLGGEPAPDALMNAFGLEQGTTVTITSYIFYKPDFGAPVMSIDVGDSKAFYRPQAEATISSVFDVAFAESAISPNPVSVGNHLSLTISEAVNAGQFRVIDLSGKLVYEAWITASGSNQFQIKLPETLTAGMYFYDFSNQIEQVRGAGKLLIK